MSGLFEWKCVRQCLPGHPLQNFLEIDQPKMNHPFPNVTKTWFIIPGTWWICEYPGWRNLCLCLRDIWVDFVPLSMNGTKNQQLSLNVNVLVFCPILWWKDIGVVIIRLQFLYGDNEMPSGEMAILSCMQFVLHADLILFAMFCHFVSGRTF